MRNGKYGLTKMRNGKYGLRKWEMVNMDWEKVKW